jgi:DNA-binding transcriptional LysR family regulator
LSIASVGLSREAAGGSARDEIDKSVPPSRVAGWFFDGLHRPFQLQPAKLQLPNPGQAESDATDRSQAGFDNQLGAYTELRDAIFGAKTGLSHVAALRRILADLSEADRAASGEFASHTGELIVSAPTELGRLHLIPTLAEFLRAYPDIDVRLLRIVSLPENHVDLALRVGVLPDSRVIALRVGTIRRVVCASPAYLEAGGTPKTPEDLAGHDCIVYEGFLGPDVLKFERNGTDLAVTVQPRLVVSNVHVGCDAARAGIGLTRAISYQVKASLEEGTLTTVLDEFQPETLPVNFVYAAGRFLPIKLRAFLDFTAPRLKARLA